MPNEPSSQRAGGPPEVAAGWLDSSPRFVQWYVRGTAYAGVSKICETLVAFLLTPFLLSRLTPDVYGLWALVLSTVAALHLADTHMATPLTNHAARPIGDADMRRLTGTALWATLMWGGLLLTSLWAASPHVLGFFGVDASLRAGVGYALFLAGLTLVAGQAQGLILSLLIGRLRGEIYHRLHAPFLLLGGAAAAGTVAAGGGIIWLAATQLGTILLETIVLAVVTFRLFPDCFPAARPSPRLFKELTHFGAKLWLAKMAFLISYHFDKILLGRFSTPAAVASYDLGHKVAFSLQRLCLLPVNAVHPATSDFASRGETEKVRAMYGWANKVLFGVSFLVMGWAALAAPQIIGLWLGGILNSSTDFARVLALGYLTGLLGRVPALVALGLGRADIEMRQGLFTAVLNVALSVGLFFAFGGIGAAWGTALAMAAGSAYCVFAFHRSSDVPLADFLRVAAAPLGAAAIAAGATLALQRWWLGPVPALATALVFKSLIFTAFYAGALWAGRYFHRSDVAALWRFARGAA